MGPNGAGKSTLLKILADAIPFQAGTRELGGNVTAGYFAQNRLDNLDPRRTVIEEALERRSRNPDVTERLARTVLGGFLFRKDDVFKKVAVLSGGEKSRLALARILLAPPNLLLMDEPTTHLDIPSIDALVNALRQYQGTLIFISHDVHFIRQVAKGVLHIAAGRLTPYAGDFDYYLDKSKAAGAREALTAKLPDARPEARPEPNGRAPAARTGPKTKEMKRAEAEERAARSAPLRAIKARVSELERTISSLETRQTEIAAELEAPETYTHPGRPQARSTASFATWSAASRPPRPNGSATPRSWRISKKGRPNSRQAAAQPITSPTRATAADGAGPDHDRPLEDRPGPRPRGTALIGAGSRRAPVRRKPAGRP